MDAIDLLFHLTNFALPALIVGFSLPWLYRLTPMGRKIGGGWWRQAGANALAGLLVLMAGLWIWGQDGKLLTYLAMVVACASSQWLVAGAGRR